MEEKEAEGGAFSQAIENRTRAGRVRKPTQKALESLGQAKPPKRGPKSGGRGRHGGRGGKVLIVHLTTYVSENLFGKIEMDLVSVFSKMVSVFIKALN